MFAERNVTLDEEDKLFTSRKFPVPRWTLDASTGARHLSTDGGMNFPRDVSL